MQRLCALILILLISNVSLIAQQKSIQIIEENDTSIYPIFYQSLDSLSENKLVGYFERDFTQKAIEKFYYLGRQSGKQYIYYPNGSIYEVSIFQNGKKEGDFSRFNTKGELIIKARYSNNQLSGFYINRKKHFQGRYASGLKHGKWEYDVGSPNYYKEFYNKGVLVVKRQVFRDSFKFWKRDATENIRNFIAEKYSVQLDSVQIPFKGDTSWYKLLYVSQDSLPHPAMRKAYFANIPNQLAHTKYIYNGFINGMYKIYYPNGKLYLYANYTASYLDGRWKQFDENGNLRIKGKYLDGKKIGKWKWNIGLPNELVEFYRSGVLKKSSNTPK